ncbi:recombination protein NinB [Pontibaca methylaminivorans]|uniref:NinB protein n=1 Tax=Pontibaca methylaminivorans TaxID=515897 RepID=A0A1R3W9E6_9RHOB|nr:recombination protein NinB [Pontibaca methylaminivorans]SIT74607.1 NinB protein [Pontibaca methylaminivorans]
MAQTVIIRGDVQRRLAKAIIDAAPIDAVVTVKEGTRTLDQNALMWALLSDIARAKPEGRHMSPELWKAAFMSALGHEIIWQPGIEGSPPFPAGFRTSRLSKARMADLITFIQAYGDRHGVRWSDEARAA